MPAGRPREFDDEEALERAMEFYRFEFTHQPNRHLALGATARTPGREPRRWELCAAAAASSFGCWTTN